MYNKNINLQHDELAAKVNINTGEIKVIENKKVNSLPTGKSRLDYENFGMINLNMLNVLNNELSNIELGIVMVMIMKAEYNTNSLAPLSNEVTVRELAEIFGIGVNTVTKTFKKLADLGVYGQLKVATDRGNEFWILNPFIYWKGRLKQDSIFNHFEGTRIVRLLRLN